MAVRPIFLLSPPRAGSTLVQRVLASHPQVQTTPEPWILLPALYAQRERGVLAEYGHLSAARAINEFAARLPGGPDGYRDALRAFALDLYGRAAGDGETYFLDKTPRYSLIAGDIIELFPDAAFIFLWRNPLAVLASTVETWADGRWGVHRWDVDLHKGLESLVVAYREHSKDVCSVRYEDLLTSPGESWPRVFAHLGLAFDQGYLERFAHTEVAGRMGDPTGVVAYRELSREPLDKWRTVLANPYRRAWAGRYLEWIGEDRLALMGYDLGELQAELGTVRSGGSHLADDLLRSAYGRAFLAWERRAMRLRR
jgi:hypothetical protein